MAGQARHDVGRRYMTSVSFCACRHPEAHEGRQANAVFIPLFMVRVPHHDNKG